MKRPAPSRLVLSLLAIALSAVPAFAQFPDRSPRIVVGQAAGGSSDTIARMVADAVSADLGQRVVIENRPGVNGAIGAEFVARSAPDGYTAFQCPMSTMSITAQLPGSGLVDAGVELVPISNVVLSSYGLVVSPGSPYHSIADILAAARARPGAVSFGSPGPGSAQHLSGELMNRMADVTMQHVPYRGAAPALVDLIAGRIDFMMTNLGDMTRQVQSGAVRLLAQGDPSRFPVFPDLPRIADTLPGFEVTGWFGFCLPRATPAAVVARWDEAIRKAMQDPAFRQRLTESGFTPHYEGPDVLATRLAADRAKWLEVIRAANLRAQ
ncbi:tripartite tricarboxylate transporter substrate binding protein [Roseococcus sp. SYP-B2431]|uniref:Bug family tripartite tricarboxylate transporter substrate binding protein n=1 Tax=Roseococcus sp. SYP-B2431 TaxID=2496640 RepID=UPI00103DDABE|nr:tripartite tricarboxylate transporter substrate binding protein [Roseococcus sp. SYP-B2431]TCH99083.1 tripartite tricarboxylate transporter substrate binding protein [Roseococcus sp. SYP-B2431]